MKFPLPLFSISLPPLLRTGADSSRRYKGMNTRKRNRRERERGREIEREKREREREKRVCEKILIER